MFYFIAVSFILVLRLVIWKFFPTLESAIKDDLSNMIMASLIFGLAAFYFIRKSFRYQGAAMTGLEGPLALFIAAAAMSLGWTVEKWLTVRALLMLLAYVFYFYILFGVLLQEQYRRFFLWVFFAVALLAAAVGINDILVLNRISAAELENARIMNRSLYYILVHKRACSFFGWPNVLAGFLMLAMPLAGALLISMKSWMARAFVLLGVGVLLTAFFLTFSFLGWSIFLVTSAVMFIVLLRTGRIRLSLKMMYVLGVVVILGLVLFTGVILKKNFAGAIAPRKDYVRVVCATIAEHPLIGAGFGAYFPASSKFVASENALTAFPHNTYAQVWAETGLPGLVAILWLVGLLVFWAFQKFRHDTKQDQWVMVAVVWGMFGYLLDNINSFTMLKPNASFFFWVWLALFCSYLGAQHKVFPSSRNTARIIMGILAVAALAGLFLSTRCMIALFALRDGKALANAGQFEPAVTLFKRARQMNPLDTSASTALGDLYLRAFRASGKFLWLDQSQTFFMEAAQRSPRAYYNHLALSSIYAARGSQVMAREELTQAQFVSPYETARDLEAMSRRK